MLVLSRKLNEAIVIDATIRVTVVGIRGNQVRLGIDAPGSVGILREELCAPAGARDRVGPAETGSAAARNDRSLSTMKAVLNESPTPVFYDH